MVQFLSDITKVGQILKKFPSKASHSKLERLHYEEFMPITHDFT